MPSWDAGVFDGVALPQEVIIRPVKETRSISMIFPIPWGSTTYWRSKPGAPPTPESSSPGLPY